MKKCLLSALFIIAACALNAEENKAATCSGPSCAPEAKADVKKEEAPVAAPVDKPDVDNTLIQGGNDAADDDGAVEATERDLERDQEQDLKNQKAGK